jgi:hypothetical protein
MYLPPPAMTRRKKHRGFNLIEAAIVLGVVGLVIGGIWVAASAMLENYKISKSIEDLKFIAINTQKIISVATANTLGTQDITTFAISSGIVPNDLVHGTSVKNRFGGALSLANHSSGPRFFIGITTIPKSSCMKLLTSVSSFGAQAGSRGNGSSARTTLGSIVVSGSPTTIIYDFPISPDTARTACASSTQSIEFNYGYTNTN